MSEKHPLLDIMLHPGTADEAIAEYFEKLKKHEEEVPQDTLDN